MALTLPLLRWLALATLIAMTAVVAMGIGKLTFNSHYTAYFDPDDPLLVDHRELAQSYSRQDAIFIVLQSRSGFLHGKNYQLLDDLTTLLAAQPFASNALSISELGIIGETLTAEGDLIPSLEQLKNDPRAIGLLLTENTTLAGISLQINLPDKKSRSMLEVIGAIRQIVDSAIGDLPVSAHYTGTLALNEAYIDVVRRDLMRIMPLLLIVMVLVIGFTLNGRRAVLSIFPIGICSVLAAFGTAGLFGAELAAINSFTPVTIFTISLAACVHMTLSYSHYRDSGFQKETAAVAAMKRNLLPMSLANGTTALGFLGLILSPSPPIRVMGYLVATGVVVSFILCMTLLPVLQARLDPWKPNARRPFEFVSIFATLIARRRTGIILIFVVLAIPAIWSASRNVINDNVFDYFPSSHAFSRDTQLVEEHFVGMNEILYSMETGQDFGFFNASAVEALDSLATWLRQQPEVRRVVSIADIDVIKEATQDGRLQRRLDFYRDRVEDFASENSLLAFGVSDNFSSAALTAFVTTLDSADLIEFDRRVHAWAARNSGDYVLRSAAPGLMFANLGEENIRGMLGALSIALPFAALILGVALRSWRVAWIALACNLLPVLLVYSVWALVVGQISIGAAVVMGMILGIVLDDTIYLLIAYQRARKRKLGDPVRYALERVGPALIVTTIALVAGLSTGLLSDFRPIWSMSILSVSIIGTALIVDLLLLPALLPTNGIRRGAR